MCCILPWLLLVCCLCAICCLCAACCLFTACLHACAAYCLFTARLCCPLLVRVLSTTAWLVAREGIVPVAQETALEWDQFCGGVLAAVGRVFHELDTDSSGQLDSDELQQVSFE